MTDSEMVCPDCGSKVTEEYEASYQEYPGACVQPAYTYYMCTNEECGWSRLVRGECISGLENTRGW